MMFHAKIFDVAHLVIPYNFCGYAYPPSPLPQKLLIRMYTATF